MVEIFLFFPPLKPVLLSLLLCSQFSCQFPVFRLVKLISGYWFKQSFLTLQVFSISFCPYTGTFQSRVFSAPTFFLQPPACLSVSLYVLLPDPYISIHPPVISPSLYVPVHSSYRTTSPQHLSMVFSLSMHPGQFQEEHYKTKIYRFSTPSTAALINLKFEFCKLTAD